MIAVAWFKRDLRVHDHAPLAAAVATGQPVLPLYIMEPGLWRLPEMAGRHFDFLRECLIDLDAALARRGARLVVRVGEATELLAALHASHGIASLHAHEETGLLWTYDRDRAVRRWARAAGVPFLEAPQHGVIRRLPSRDGWARAWDRFMAARRVPAPGTIRFADLPSGDMPDAAALGLGPDPCPERQQGGRAAALERLRSFLEVRGRDYRRTMASPLLAYDACSRLSADLALGTLSMREALQAASRALSRHREAGDASHAASLRSFVSRLHWHCHFIQKLEDEPGLERRNLHRGYDGLRPEPADPAVVAAWIEGRTGFPFVDACMRALAATGWLNFRMRAMAMSFSSYHLWQHWRQPAIALARRFTDFEAGIHYPQAQMQSGTTGVNTARIYNPVKQSRDQDPEGVFIRRWVPELAALPNSWLHEPWAAPPALLADRGLRLGETYPRPLVDPVRAAREARERIHALRRTADHRAEAGEIQQKHGSRRSGLGSAERPRRRRGDQGQRQGSLPLD
jgi:deoxyribodipyrimidine photo-lyase